MSPLLLRGQTRLLALHLRQRCWRWPGAPSAGAQTLREGPVAVHTSSVITELMLVQAVGNSQEPQRSAGTAEQVCTLCTLCNIYWPFQCSHNCSLKILTQRCCLARVSEQLTSATVSVKAIIKSIYAQKMATLCKAGAPVTKDRPPYLLLFTSAFVAPGRSPRPQATSAESLSDLQVLRHTAAARCYLMLFLDQKLAQKVLGTTHACDTLLIPP